MVRTLLVELQVLKTQTKGQPFYASTFRFIVMGQHVVQIKKDKLPLIALGWKF
jgi:hypothetical protein